MSAKIDTKKLEKELMKAALEGVAEKVRTELRKALKHSRFKVTITNNKLRVSSYNKDEESVINEVIRKFS